MIDRGPRRNFDLVSNGVVECVGIVCKNCKSTNAEPGHRRKFFLYHALSLLYCVLLILFVVTPVRITFVVTPARLTAEDSHFDCVLDLEQIILFPYGHYAELMKLLLFSGKINDVPPSHCKERHCVTDVLYQPVYV